MAVVSLIVMEKGSEWPGHVGDSESLVAMNVGEDASLERTRQRLELLRHQGTQVRVALLACAEGADDASARRRAELAHELLAAVTVATCGRLALCAPDRASLRLRQELMSLAGELSDHLPGTMTTVSVRFGHEPCTGKPQTREGR